MTKRASLCALVVLAASLAPGCADLIAGFPDHYRYDVSPPGVTDIYRLGDHTRIAAGTIGKDKALWFSDSAPPLRRITMNGRLSDIQLPDRGGQTQGIASGPDGSIWVALSFPNKELDNKPDKLVRVLPSRAVRTYATPTANGWIYGIAVRRNGDVLFTENFAGKIGCRFVDGRFREIRLSDPKSGPTDIALAADDSAWFVERDSNRLGLLSKNFQLREFSVSRADGKLFWLSDLAVDTAGNAWVIKNPAEVEEGRIMPSFRDAGGRIIMVDRHGRVREYPVGLVNGITRGPDGRIWFTRHASFGRIGPDGTITTFSSPKEGLGFILAAPDGNLWFVVGLPAPIGYGDWEGIGKFALR